MSGFVSGAGLVFGWEGVKSEGQETYVRAQHNRRLLRRRYRNHLEIPRHVTQSIGNIRNHLTRESLIAIRISQAESDAISRMGDHSPISPIPAIWATVQSVRTSRCLGRWVFIGKNMIRRPIDLKSAILDTICIPSWYAPKMRMLAILFPLVSSHTYTLNISRNLNH